MTNPYEQGMPEAKYWQEGFDAGKALKARVAELEALLRRWRNFRPADSDLIWDTDGTLDPVLARMRRAPQNPL